MRKAFEVFVVLCAVFTALALWNHHEEKAKEKAAGGDWNAAAGQLPQPVIPPVEELNRGFVEERPPVETIKPAKKHFWERAPKNEAEEGQFAPEGQAAGEDIPRRMTPREQYGLPLPDHFCGVQLILWERGCPKGEEAVAGCTEYCRTHPGYTIGDNAGCDVWVARVPVQSEPRCPQFVFFDEGRPVRPKMIGYAGAWQLPFIFARIPKTNSDVGTWYSERQPPRRPHSQGWGPGIGIQYSNATSIGLGLGFGSGWRPRKGEG
jgi:hypothetical protein